MSIILKLNLSMEWEGPLLLGPFFIDGLCSLACLRTVNAIESGNDPLLQVLGLEMA